MTILPFIVWAIGTAGLFYLNRDRALRTSKAVWLAVVWFSIVGSRPITVWLGLGSGTGGLDATLEGDSTDAAIFLILIIAGASVLSRRKEQIRTFFANNRPLLIYFAFCLLSVFWSPIPGPSFKRWVKAIGDVVMMLIVATDARPIEAVRRFFSHVGFLLLPASVLLIRYSDLGRGYDPDGNPMNTGVTTNKNMLGVLVLVVGLATVWHVYAMLRAKEHIQQKARMLAQCTLLVFSVALLAMAHSATCIACFVLGSGVILISSLPAVVRKRRKVHAVIMGIIIAGGLAMLLGVDEAVLGALGRDATLTGRTDIWRAVIPLARDPIIGSGFESFWNSRASILRTFEEVNMFRDLNSAHNGYIEVYLNLGWIGIGLILTVWLSAYRLVGKAFRIDPETGSLLLCFVMIIPVFNISEAGFRLFNPMWICFALSYVLAGQIARNRRRPRELNPLVSETGRLDQTNALSWSLL